MRDQLFGVIGEVDTLPGCSQVAVSHGVFTPAHLRGKGNATKANLARTVIMKSYFGYDYALCTVAADNVAQIKIMEKNAWKRLDTFPSSKTNHEVHLYGKVL